MRLKNSITTVLFLCFCVSASAQTNKGNFALSGKTNLNFLFSNATQSTDSVETGKINNHQFAFSAAAGYFVIDHLNLGISGSYSYDYTKSNSSNYFPAIIQSRTQSFTIIPQVNYFIPIAGKLKPVAGAGLGYMWLEERDSRVNENGNLLYSMSGTTLTGSVGVSYFILPSVSFDLGFQFSHANLKEKSNPSVKQKINSTTGNLGITVFL